MRSSKILTMVLAAAVVLGGCGDDASEPTSDAAASIDATAREYEFTPEAWTVPTGESFTIELTNDGTVEHEWAVLRLGEDIESEADFAEDKVLFEVEALPAGESETATFTIDEPGTYQVICAISGHFGQGMEGALSVE
ncbi:cupredoxin domain-containing protein [Salsipaludibacter albus]|uniref:cupredoxin domain-containing protein n=1 Tax=Salsipaludibacter albus TaxID=2849650 RepID=UPI001EE43D0A|nr:cupredoxin domain-containing protein [Salsipaludibacter albus]MBY5163579.1 cupredoxin domain-containing protein [Salsipaludibacter albus]